MSGRNIFFKGALFLKLFLFVWLLAQSDQSLFEIAKSAFDDKAYNFAIGRFGQLVQNYPESSFRGDALYYLVAACFNIGETKDASQYLKTFLSEYPLHSQVASARYYQCLILYRENRLTACVEACHLWIQKNPRDKEAGRWQILMAKAYTRLGQEEIAIQTFQDVKIPYRNESLVTLINYFLEHDNPEKALDVVKSISGKISPEIEEKLAYLTPKIHFFLGEWDSAEKMFQTFLEAYPNSSSIDEVRFLTAYIPYERKDHDEAISRLKLYALNSRNPFYVIQAKFFVAKSYEKKGQDILALTRYNEILKSKENQDFFWNSLSRIYAIYNRRNDRVKANEILQKLSQSPIEEFKTFALKEFILSDIKKENIDQAELHFEFLIKATSSAQGQLAHHRWFSDVLIKSGLFSKANHILMLAMTYQANSQPAEIVDILFSQGENYFQMTNYDLAKEKYLQALKSSSPLNKERIEERIAYIAYQQKNYKSALKRYQKLADSSNELISRTASFMVGEMNHAMGSLSLALQSYRRFVDRYGDDPNVPEVYHRIGTIYYQQKNYTTAFVYFNRASKKGDASLKIKAIYRMGWSKYRMGLLGEARDLFASLYELDRTNHYVYEGLLVAATIEYDRKNYQSASDHYFKVINNRDHLSDSSQLPDAYYELGQCFLKLRDEKQCESVYLLLQRDYPEDHLAHHRAFLSLAEHYAEKAKYEDAIRNLNRIEEDEIPVEDMNYFDYFFADLYGQLDRSRSRLEYLEKIIQRGKSSFYWDAVYLKAETLKKTGDISTSIDIYRSIVDKSEREDIVRLARKQLTDTQYSQEIQKVERSQSVEEISSLFPSLTQPAAKAKAHYKLAGLYKVRGDEANALKHYKLVLQYPGEKVNEFAQIEIIRYYFKNQDYLNSYNEAMTYFYLFRRYEIDKEEILYIACISAYRTDNLNDAKKFTKEFKSRFPKSKYLSKLPIFP